MADHVFCMEYSENTRHVDAARHFIEQICHIYVINVMGYMCDECYQFFTSIDSYFTPLTINDSIEDLYIGLIMNFA